MTEGKRAVCCKPRGWLWIEVVIRDRGEGWQAIKDTQ